MFACNEMEAITNKLSEKEESLLKLNRVSCLSQHVDPRMFKKVSCGPSFNTLAREKMQGMYLKGENVLEKEIKAAEKIKMQNEGNLLFVKNHIGKEGEPHSNGQEIVIQC